MTNDKFREITSTLGITAEDVDRWFGSGARMALTGSRPVPELVAKIARKLEKGQLRVVAGNLEK